MSLFKRVKNFIRTTLIGGLVVILPITIFALLVKLVFDFMRKVVEPLSRLLDFGLISNELLIDLLALTLIILFCFLVGLFVRTRIGRMLVNRVEKRLMERLPLYGTIKETVQQFTGAKKMPFSDVVLVDVFSNDTRMLGFITDEHSEDRYTVFVPTGPNPTNGFIFNVSKSQLEFLNVKSDEAMRIIIGVGTGASSLFYKNKPENKPEE